MRGGRHQHHATLAPRNIGEARWMRRVAIVAVPLLQANNMSRVAQWNIGAHWATRLRVVSLVGRTPASGPSAGQNAR
ncbi:hypothetical protein OESDEN_22247 [Oesophagostomum dentatum]|uniref:Uncharacterized protein n=1 Tax=Oesophagostomum dentatum TaxID=61180 RepID=A0A0B1RYM4_OESDE|nr:hypothetical protein OESDEN_22247 [Oesophagostomum dentatum]